ncbi:MAG TPA: PEPxxWA-CTERM sorting domain-containing protein [Sphingomicrobium sp.]|nr:PEPxxWA-CTERM sorting domain-containing protein [Sphingomicrobium sp.]
MVKSLLAFVGAAALTVTSNANASAIITFGATSPVPGNNDFQSDLASLGLTLFTTTGATITLNEDSVITFEVLGTESSFDDRFTANGVDYTETTTFANLFGTPLSIGSDFFTSGSLWNVLNFSSAGGMNATVGDDGFGIFLGANDLSGLSTNVFYIGYDDQVLDPDDNHDDLVIRATVSPAVPEPATWAMMLLGFGAIGFALRRYPLSEVKLRRAG